MNENCNNISDISAPISNAISLSLAKKCEKMSNFLNQNQDNLERRLQHLCGFALSSGGLIKDEYRKRIWPILAKNLPEAECLKPNKSQFLRDEATSSNHITKNNKDENIEIEGSGGTSNISDSDFESAISNMSSSALFGDDEDERPNHMDDEENINNDGTELPTPVSPITLEELQSHSEWRQVELDVARTLARFPPDIDENRRQILQEQLTKIIVQLLYENVNFHYYQGFHDVCLTFLLVLGDNDALRALKYICKRGSFNNYLTYTLEESVLKELEILYLLLYLHDHEIERKMRDNELGILFALSWPLTWFSHALQDYSQVVLFFDFLLCSHYLMPIYISAALVCERREEILDCEPEMPLLHKLLNEVPAKINCNRILDTARALFARYPPDLLKELQNEYLQICERQRRQRSAIHNLEITQMRIAREELLRRGNFSLRQNVYEAVKPFVIGGGVAAMAFAYYYVQRNIILP